MLGQMLSDLAQVDRWLDENVSDEYKSQPLAQDWARITKVAEELGEVVDAFILHTGQNPRKETRALMDAVLDELADVAFTAILAIQHFTKDEAVTGKILVDKNLNIYKRMMQHKVEQYCLARDAKMALDALAEKLGATD